MNWFAAHGITQECSRVYPCVFAQVFDDKSDVCPDFFRLSPSDISFEEVVFAYYSVYSKREMAAKISRSGDIECLWNSTRSRSAILCIFWYVWGHWKCFDLEIFWWQDCIFRRSLLLSLLRDVVGCVGLFARFYYTLVKDGNICSGLRVPLTTRLETVKET